MFTDIYLRASGQIALDNALQAAGLLDEAAEILADGVYLDRIGEIAGTDGYHANLRLAFEPSAEQVDALFPVTILPPANPVRVWG